MDIGNILHDSWDNLQIAILLEIAFQACCENSMCHFNFGDRELFLQCQVFMFRYYNLTGDQKYKYYDALMKEHHVYAGNEKKYWNTSLCYLEITTFQKVPYFTLKKVQTREIIHRNLKPFHHRVF